MCGRNPDSHPVTSCPELDTYRAQKPAEERRCALFRQSSRYAWNFSSCNTSLCWHLGVSQSLCSHCVWYRLVHGRRECRSLERERHRERERENQTARTGRLRARNGAQCVLHRFGPEPRPAGIRNATESRMRRPRRIDVQHQLPRELHPRTTHAYVGRSLGLPALATRHHPGCADLTGSMRNVSSPGDCVDVGSTTQYQRRTSPRSYVGLFC
jgi:hypothetical protein